MKFKTRFHESFRTYSQRLGDKELGTKITKLRSHFESEATQNISGKVKWIEKFRIFRKFPFQKFVIISFKK